MRFVGWLCVTTASLALTGCGSGGGGGTSSAGTVAAPAAPATNTTLTNLQASQTFTNDAAATTVSFDLTNKTTITGKAAAESLLVSYDAASKSYTVTTGNRSQTFAPADITTSSTPTNDTKYQRTDSTYRDYLTLVKTPYSGSTATQYVGLGYWQRNSVTGNRQDTTFDTFTYGLITPSTAVPRTGIAAFGIDAFGLSAFPGKEPREFEGHGTFSIDFAANVFSATTSLHESGLVTGGDFYGGGVQLQAGGHLAAGDGSLSGNALYGSGNGNIAGTLAGHFYGPGAEEVGASFSGSNADGAAFNGAFTGQRTGATPANLTLLNLVGSQLFYLSGADFESFFSSTYNSLSTDQNMMAGQLTIQAGTYNYSPGRSDLPIGLFTSSNMINGGDSNFTSYQKTLPNYPLTDQQARVDIYKSGSSNSELALTYVTFGRWSSTTTSYANPETDKVYSVFGFNTPSGLLAARTGNAHYSGVAYGSGATPATNTLYDIKGTSGFDIDFSSSNYNGNLALAGKSLNGGAAADFGNFTFSGKLATNTSSNTAYLMQNGANVGSISHSFYGPDGEEIAGPFTVNKRDSTGRSTLSIAGVALAKRQ